MASSIILKFQSWISTEAGRQPIDALEPSIISEEHAIVSDVLNPLESKTYFCGKRLTYMVADRFVNFSLNSGETFSGDMFLCKLDGSTTNSLHVTAGSEKTKVKIVAVD